MQTRTSVGSDLDPSVHSHDMATTQYLRELILRWTEQVLELERVLIAQEKLASLGTLTAVRGQFSVRSFGHQKSAPLAVIPDST